MSVESKIEWCDDTWNVVAGCSKVSEGCRNCYAIPHAHRLAGNPNQKISQAYAGTTNKVLSGFNNKNVGQINWSGKVNLRPDLLEIPLKKKKPTRYFVNSMSDLFHRDVPLTFIKWVFEIMRQAHWHTFQILTKRDVLMWARVTDIYNNWAKESPIGECAPLSNVWLGVSVEDQESAERINMLSQTEAAIRFVSCEPLLQPVDLTEYLDVIDWVIIGGESGHKARPMNEDWVRSIIQQCKAANVNVFYKQKMDGKKKISLPILDGRTWAEIPGMEVRG